MMEPPQLGPLLRDRRQARKWTLDDLASTSGVSRSMLSQIERGQANPTFATLWHLTQALGVRIDDLVADPSEASEAIEVLNRAETPRLERDGGGAQLLLLAPPELVGGVEWYEICLAPGASLDSSPHLTGTKEHLTVLEGRVRVTAGVGTEELDAGTTARYRADLDHEISNEGKKPARLLLVVIGVEDK